MDKAEYRIKLEQINNLAENGDFKGAAAIADTIEWKRVKSVRTLCMIGEIYEANRRYSDSEQILKYAYRQSSTSKTVLYRLAEIEIRMGFYDEAKKYYQEFEELSPHDTSRYILKYKLLRAQGAPLSEQIEVLREYKEREYTERWAFELARLYKKNGQKQRCIEECDDMILWFAEGKYVTRAMELKMQLEPLSEAQQISREADFSPAAVNKMIDIQARWKKIGPAEREYNEQLWTDFKAVMDNYFKEKNSFLNQKHEAWVAKTQNAIDRRREKLANIIRNNEKLQDRLDTTHNEEKIEQITGWINENNAQIADLEADIERMEAELR